MTINKEEAIRDSVEMLAEDLGLKLDPSQEVKIREFLSANLVPAGTVPAPKKRTRVPKETVRAIVAEYDKMLEENDGKGSMTQLAAKYGVNVSTVQRYISGTLRAELRR